MTVTSRANQPEDLATSLASYRRLAAMDPPAMRSLVAELRRIADESSASAVQHACKR
jgi:hypothetical protein